ncbi:hypothetical protein QBZ16_002255 [Prototheca wickerhamii]|uniref:Uncharacterized protein n=1 Tax=Prototheca wickerhamii TaxID=3111 RepID=A0AAD9MLK4_PROWI|nr:hypothetical protein QBZ16_002255 [Prototheca wickerhamii]
MSAAGHAEPIQRFEALLGSSPLLKHSIAGTCGGFNVVLVGHPFGRSADGNWIRQQTSPSYKAPFTTLRQAVRASFQANGLRGPFQGLGITIVRNLPANALYMSSFELTKRRLAGWQGISVHDLSLGMSMVAGSVAGIGFWIFVYPLDVIKSAMMTDSMVKADRRCTTAVQTAKLLERAMLGTVSRLEALLGA